MTKTPLATLLTDFGTADPYVAAMKGVILGRCPRAQIVDISHDVPAHDVLAAAIVLAEAAPWFPPETLHVVVVDPGVGTERHILAGRCGGQRFLFPDNGVITLVAEGTPFEALVAVRSTDYLPPGPASLTFHGRDVFAPLAGDLLNGLDIGRLGPQPARQKLLDIPAPREEQDDLVGQVIYVDRFGNLVSNIVWSRVPPAWADPSTVRVRCGGREVGPLQGTYGFVGPGEPLALINSMGRLEVAVNRGRACDVLAGRIGMEIRLARA